MNPLPPELLQAVLLVTSIVVVGMLLSLVVQRTIRRRRLRRIAELDARHRRLVLEATIAEDDELEPLLARVRSFDAEERAHVGRTVFLMLRDITGEAAERLRAVALASGLVPRVLHAAERRSAVARADAAEALGLLAPEGALELLLRLSADRDAEVRTVAVRALGSFDDTLAIDRVIEALATDSGVPASVAASALLQQGTAAVARVRWALDDADPGVRRGAARVAGLLQVPAAGEALTRLVADEHESVRLAAMRSLELLPVRESLPVLLDAALGGGVVGEAAANAIVRMPSSWQGEALARIAAEAEPGVRRAAGLPRAEAAA
ncbi:HEAT repeat domain-containing protein [Agrococcus beijingensis]|uniref:HEAT repeat domain-containing protein n=1 Tax=Agrococcus beijingensis TaxID=3068634 RepID=UPI0027423C30|nr:HEAT repeat domain-containing protein [Agrococcus sp. REN33]